MTRIDTILVSIFTDNTPFDQDKFQNFIEHDTWKFYSTFDVEIQVGQFIYAEDLIFSLLKELGIGPVCRTLFGLKLKKSPCWLAPQSELKTVFDNLRHELDKINIFDLKRPNLELRMRFRPASFVKIHSLDNHAFRYIFSQVRYDFMNNTFKHDIELMINPDVLGLISSDILRHLLESDVQIENFGTIDFQEFVPYNVHYYQKKVFSLLKKRIKRCVHSGYRARESRDVDNIKHGFIEEFLKEIKKDYAAETYKMKSLGKVSSDTTNGQVRVRYLQEGFCIIETNFGKSGTWSKQCDITEINFGIWKERDADFLVELNWSRNNMKLSFETSIEAKSFLSLLDGYHRLMKKWPFNFCNNLISPDLTFLASIKSHGPIGAQAMIKKLSRHKEPGTYLVRQSYSTYDRYRVDVVYPPNSRLTFDIIYDPSLKTYHYDLERPVSYEKESKLRPIVLREDVQFKTLDEILSEVQIEIFKNTQPLQLKYCIGPSDSDDYLLLLLSMSEEQLLQMEDRCFNHIPKTISDLPRVIPKQILKIPTRQTVISGRLLTVQTAYLYNRKVIVKSPDMINCQNYISKRGLSVQPIAMPTDIRNSLKSKISDWIFVKHVNLAEIIGLEPMSYALVQEYFTYGSLDCYIKEKSSFNDKQKKTVARQLAQALIYLQEKKLVHGKIRCHNLFIRTITPLHIKLSDPLGTYDLIKDRAFFPPEYSYLRTVSNTTFRDSGLDVWAYGTTVWQMFNNGEMPPPNKSGCLELSKLSGCSILRSIVRRCWQSNPVLRIQPKSIYRDLSVDNDDLDSTDDYVETDCFHFDKQNGTSEGSKYLTSVTTTDILDCSERSSPITSVCNSSYGTSDPLLELRSSDGFFLLKYFRRIYHRSDGILKTRQEPDTQSNNNDSLFHQNGRKEESIVGSLDLSAQHRNENPLRDYDQSKIDLIERVGTGSGGAVYRAVLNHWPTFEDETLVAIKVAAADNDKLQAEDLKREHDILQKLKNHINIVNVIGIIGGEEPMLVMEYVPLGSLLLALKNTPPSEIANLPLKKYALDIASAMEFLENEKVVHRDLALRNILLETHTSVKLCDFGLAQVLDPDENNYSLKTDRALPLKWYAPETLNSMKFSHKTDVWSYGILLWEIYSGGCSPQYPCKYSQLSDLLMKNLRLNQPATCPTEMYALMMRCWAYDPEHRDSFATIREKINGLMVQFQESMSEGFNYQVAENLSNGKAISNE